MFKQSIVIGTYQYQLQYQLFQIYISNYQWQWQYLQKQQYQWHRNTIAHVCLPATQGSVWASTSQNVEFHHAFFDVTKLRHASRNRNELGTSEASAHELIPR